MKTKIAKSAIEQGTWSEEYAKKQHNEDCLDANDDTSVLKGKCICPKSQHTPTPWDYHLGRGKNPRFHIQTTAGYQIVMTPEVSQNGIEASAQEANAAFIVRAVNSHEAMLSALKRMLNAYEADKKHGIAFGNDNAADQAREAIAAAEGKP